MKKSVFVYIIFLCLAYLLTQSGVDDTIRYRVMMAKHNARLPFIESIHIPEDAPVYRQESNLNNQGLSLETDHAYYIVDDGLLLYQTDKNFNRQLPFEVTSPSAWIHDLQVVGDWLFYTDKYISRVKLDGTGETHLFSGWASDMYVTPKWIYFVNFKDGSRLTRMTINGEDMTRLSDYYFRDLLFDGDQFVASIRTSTEESDDNNYNLVTLDLSGHIKEVLIENMYGSGIIRKEETLYFRGNDSLIYAYDLINKSIKVLIETPVSYFAMDDDYIFYTGRDLSTKLMDAVGLYRYDLETGERKTFDEDILMSTGQIQLLDDTVLIESDYKKDPFNMIRFDRDGDNRTTMTTLRND